jgi:phage shock protein E
MRKLLFHMILVILLGSLSIVQVIAEASATGDDQEPAAQQLRGDAEAAREGWKLLEEGALLIDVRSAGEFAGGSIEGALNIPHSETDRLLEAIGADKNRPVVMFCGSGRRVDRAIGQLEALGYSALFNATGFDALKATKP